MILKSVKCVQGRKKEEATYVTQNDRGQEAIVASCLFFLTCGICMLSFAIILLYDICASEKLNLAYQKIK